MISIKHFVNNGFEIIENTQEIFFKDLNDLDIEQAEGIVKMNLRGEIIEYLIKNGYLSLKIEKTEKGEILKVSLFIKKSR
jgi:hypothetical protein